MAGSPGVRRGLSQVLPQRDCPRCHGHRLHFDPKTGRLWCPDCGFEAHVPMHG